MIIDTHVHLGSKAGHLKELMEMVHKLKIDKVCLFTAGPGYYRTSNDDVMKAHLEYPDVIIPFYYLRLGVDGPRVVERAHRDGFRGLKLINPTRNYNDESYFPVWERCEDLGMITVFHTGIVGRNPQQIHFDIDSSRMKVIYLDRIAHFVDCIQNGTQPITPGEDGRDAVQLIEAAYRSAKEGKPIELPLS